MKKQVCAFDLEGPISIIDFAADIGRLLNQKPELDLKKYDMGEFFFMISNYDDYIEITWFYDSASVEKAFRDSAESKFRMIIDAINTALVSDFGFSELEIGSIYFPERSKYLKNVVSEIPENAFLMSIMVIQPS